jgi:hypothetical protein
MTATSKMRAASAASNPVDPTLVQLREMIAEYNSVGDEDRMTELHEALINARPTDPAVLAAWLRWATEPGLNVTGVEGGVAHVADQLEAMAAPGAVTLKPDAVAAIRDALVAAIEFHGGDVDHEPDPGLSEGVRQLQAQAQTALVLLAEGRP